MAKKMLVLGLIVLSFVLAGCKKATITGNAVIEEPAAEKMTEKCKDSDGGINKMAKGVVRVDGKEYRDECVAGLLIEYYCEGDNVVNQNMRCTDGCSGGRCS
ncbi:hypothetical protein KY358_03565 [Candidatus Woesearchaeota archaeon]|nr:hypothetical protein [Candidatus Woesearchaeota archaeon]